MPAAFDLVTVDTPDTARLSAFWRAALDLHEVEDEDDGRWLVLADADGVRRIGLQRGSSRGSTIHLDLRCTQHEFESELVRLVGLGATPVAPPRREPYGSIANLADPDGNPFDLCAYD